MSSLIKLNSTNLNSLTETIKIPRYDRKLVKAGIVHIGIGGFHRAHQAYFTNSLLEKGTSSNWGICGIALLKTDRKIFEVLSGQDGLYTLMVPDSNGNFTAEVIGSIVELLYAPEDPWNTIERIADPLIKIITLTITEGGYNFTSDGNFNWENESVLWDLQHPKKPKTIFGYLYSALKLRQLRGLKGLTIQSCDNIEHNGNVAKKMFFAFVSKTDPEMMEWLSNNVTFPNSMVDRITPVTTEILKTDLAKTFGLQDNWPVISEQFYQWIIEDKFINGRPEWEKVGAQFVPNVSPYEKMKIRLLNGGHTLVGLAGYLFGYRFIHESVSNPLIGVFLRNYINDEVTPTLDDVPGIALEDYKNTIIQRFKNQFIKDEVARIISGSSAKFPKFILPTVFDRLKEHQSVNAAALIISTWYFYLKANIFKPSEVQDDLAEVLLKKVEEGELANNPLLFLNNVEVFGDLQTDPAFTENFLSHIIALRNSSLSSHIKINFNYHKIFQKDQ